MTLQELGMVYTLSTGEDNPMPTAQERALDRWFQVQTAAKIMCSVCGSEVTKQTHRINPARPAEFICGLEIPHSLLAS